MERHVAPNVTYKVLFRKSDSFNDFALPNCSSNAESLLNMANTFENKG